MHFGVCVPEFMTADVSQGHGLPGCNGKRNNITIHLQTNVELKSSYTFTISGLHVSNVQYETGFGYDAQVSIAETASESEIHVAGENFTADTVYEIIVSALNTGDAEEYSRDSLTVSATAFDNPLSKSLEELTGMEVEAVDMTASIRQSTPCPFAIHTLTFEMQTNVVLPVGAKITISGLTKTSSHKPTLDLFSCSTSSSSESMLSKEAAWNAASGELVMDAQSRIEAKALVSGSFRVINPDTANLPPSAAFSISCEEPCDESCHFPIGPVIATAGGAGSPFEGCLKCSEPCIGCGQPCDAADSEALRVHAPGVVLKHVRATTDWPMANNTIGLDLVFNFDVMAPTILTVTGVGGVKHLRNPRNNCTDAASCGPELAWTAVTAFSSINLVQDDDAVEFPVHHLRARPSQSVRASRVW
jgi:hypothetical protein